MQLFENFFNYESFMPHGYCYLWAPDLIWLHIFSDIATALAYFSIPAFIYYLLVFKWKKTKYPWIVVLFSLFIFLCGLTHIMDVVVLWYPYYWIQGLLKALTAIVSMISAISIVIHLPKFLKD